MLNNIVRLLRQQIFTQTNKLCYKKCFITNMNRQNNYSTTIQEEENNIEIDEKYINKAIGIHPKLAAISKEMWNKSHETFVNCGFSSKDFFQIVVKNPAVVTRTPQKNIESMERWRSCQFGEKLFHNLLVTYPDLLNTTDERKILQRTTFLKDFLLTNKNVWRVLMTCPNVLEEREEHIEEKLNYMLNTMRVEFHEIAKSEALNRSLNEIRCRHVFLERLNLFKPRSLKDNIKHQTNNHRLHEITDTTDRKFAINIAQVTVAEYEAFKELFKRELQRKEDENDDEVDDD